MKTLLSYINGLTPQQRTAYFSRCITTEAYVRKLAYLGKQPGELMALRLAYESRGAVSVYDLRPDVDWRYVVRASRAVAASAAPPGPEPAIKSNWRQVVPA